MHTLHGSMPKNNAILWLAHMRSAVEKLRRDELDIGCGDGCTGSGIQHHLLAASFAFFAEKFNITKTTVTYMVAAEADEKKAKFVVWQHEPACLLTDVAQLSSNRWHNWANGGVLRSSLSVLLRGRCRCVVVFCVFCYIMYMKSEPRPSNDCEEGGLCRRWLQLHGPQQGQQPEGDN